MLVRTELKGKIVMQRLSKDYIVSRAEDLEIVIWDLAKSTPKDIEIYKSLKWPDSDGSTGLRFKVIEKNGMWYLLIPSSDFS